MPSVFYGFPTAFSFANPLAPEMARKLPARNLAYIGDSVFELGTRLTHCFSHTDQNHHLQGSVVNIVCAENQARAFDKLLAELPEEEKGFLKSWRNAKLPRRSLSVRNATYAKSTAFEAWVGYLFLTGQNERLLEVINLLKIQAETSPEASQP